jgi:iron(II)-dependent oxidoreductase
MAGNALKSSRLSTAAAQTLDGLEIARARTLELVAQLDDEQLQRVYSPIMSPLVWDLGHIAAYEDLWLAHRQGEMPLLHPELADLYDAFETPRAIRGEIEALGPRAAREYLQAVRERTIETLAERGVSDAVVFEMVTRHELQHSETMRQTLAIAGLLQDADIAASESPLERLEGPGQWVELPAGGFEMGATADGFAYDNERPRHRVETPAFRIARLPVSNEAWVHFSEQGGYERRAWWSAEGWEWRRQQPYAQHPAIESGDPRAPACHVSFFEAEAFARAHDCRLPSEAEWERAATWAEQSASAGRASGRRARGVLDAVGRVWEWTDSLFGGYPGFVAHPYREYSEVFFGGHYRVLRGGSWATDERVANPRFRNWDLPQRRQIFSGLRLACDAN